ncbi:MAG TPA: YciI family protein [Steroidobacteraceae bacterium]|nr:YciI family protein [Steroidobacteraceae bacterium]
MHRLTCLVASVLLTAASMLAIQVHAQAADAPSREGGAVTNPAQQFLYVLRLVPRLHDDAAWTEADNAAVARHFEHLKQATAAGKVILAGRTREPGDKTFGLVIFEAADEAEAQRFMAADPAVVAGVMTATLHPYAVALQRER